MPPATLFTGKTLEDAVKKGLEALGLARAEAMITVIEEGSSGFLGLGAHPYRVRIMPRPGGAIREADESGDREPRGRRERGAPRGREARPARGRGGDRAAAPAAAPAAGRGERRGRRQERPAEARGERPAEARGERPAEARGERPAEARGERRPRGEERRKSERRAAEPQVRGGERRDEPARPAIAPEREPQPVARMAPDLSTGDGGEEGARRRRRRGRRGGRGRGGPGRGPESVESGMPEESISPMAVGAVNGDEGAVDKVGTHESREAHEMREPREAHEMREPREAHEMREPREAHEAHEMREPREPREAHEMREPREMRSGEPALSNDALAAQGKRWAEELLGGMGFDAQVSATAEEDRVDVVAEVASNEELLNGPKGEVRQALQHLLNRMVNRGEGSRYHLQLEINDFWKRREEELEQLARRLADEAVAGQIETVTEYLNAQERRIIHVTLREDTRVKTYALGDGMIKRLAVAPVDYPEGARGE